MKLLKILKRLLPPVQLRPIKGMTRDLRVPSNPWQAALQEHRRKRFHECRKVSTTTYLPVIPHKSSPKGGRSSHIDPAKQRPSGSAELQPTALHRALTEPAFLRRQAN